jgi:hypothetical protein
MALIASALAGVWLVGCSSTKRFELRQTIEMGPFSFRVERASSSVGYVSGRQQRVIEVDLWLLSGESESDVDLGPFFSPGNTLVSHPHIRIEDRHGHEFPGRVGVPAGDHWPVSFQLAGRGGFSPAERERAEEIAESHLEMGPRDFRLFIRNPDRRGQQPREVWIQLREYRPTR